jgi:hypothetical protein
MVPNECRRVIVVLPAHTDHKFGWLLTADSLVHDLWSFVVELEIGIRETIDMRAVSAGMILSRRKL